MVRRNFYFVSWTEAAMDDQQAGPSGINLRPKRPRIEVRDPNRLTYNEMEQILYNSDTEISDLDSDFEVISEESEDNDSESEHGNKFFVFIFSFSLVKQWNTCQRKLKLQIQREKHFERNVEFVLKRKSEKTQFIIAATALSSQDYV